MADAKKRVIGTPDVQNLEFLNKVIHQVWPFADAVLTKMLKEVVEPEVRKKMPSIVPGKFRFVTSSLGKIPVRFGGIKVYTEYVKDDEIIMDIDIDYAGDLDIEFGLGVLTAGIEKVTFKGKLRVEIQPMMEEVPLIGGVSICFLESPKIDFDLTDLANVLDFPGISHILHKVLGSVVDGLVVMPKKIRIPLMDTDEVKRAMYFQPPMGLLNIQILSGADLVAADDNIFSKDDADPYVKCKVASRKYSTKVVDNTLNPKWNETFALFIDMLPGTNVKFEVYDEDTINDDNLGKCEVSVLDVLLNHNFKNQTLKLQGVKTGTLDVRCGWMKFSDDVNDIKEVEDVKAIAALFVTIKDAKALPATDKEKGTSDSFAEVQVGDETVQTKTIKGTVDPNWNEAFFFVLNALDDDGKVVIKIKDDEIDEALGEVTFDINSLKEQPKMTVEKDFPINKDDDSATISLIFELKALTAVIDPDIEVIPAPKPKE